MSHRPRPAVASPSLVAVPDGEVAAYELKFLLPEAAGRELEAWAAGHLDRDPFADPAADFRYRVTSVYFDTPTFDVLRKTAGHRTHKHRVRRYGAEPTVHLERKSKRDGRVWKTRSTVPLAELPKLGADGPAGWFATELADRDLRPVGRVAYDRAAFVGVGPTGPIRVTLDRNAIGAWGDELTLEPPAGGVPLLTDEVVVEFKYLVAMPAVFKDAVEAFRLAPASMSKYRRCAAVVGGGAADA